jgi:pyruvate ferredoxin oxidoreductase gamma subunit/2-oxoisovalerate ferredoxin oxidoreductase gamma subunit
MIEIRIHARAGQGAITTAAVLGYAYVLEGKWVYSFPHFGAARMGAPMNAFMRVSKEPVRTKSRIMNPDYLLILDPTLLEAYDVFVGLKEGATVVIDSDKKIVEKPNYNIYFVPASEIAKRIMGRPLGNMAVLGYFAKITNEVKKESLIASLKHRFSEKTYEVNKSILEEGYNYE